MSVILDQIAKAERKAKFDVESVVRSSRDKVPAQLADDLEKGERKQFLRDSLQDISRADHFYERIIAGNELQDINYLERGAVAARAVGRIAIRRRGILTGWGTGFLIAPNVLLTNHHVLPDAALAKSSQAHFAYERTYQGEESGPCVFALEPDRLFHADEKLDFAVVGISSQAENSDEPLSSYGYLPLLEVTGKVADGEWLSIIQHPNGELKQVCVRENKLLKRTENELWYSTDTLGGSSGSPVFNNDWYVVALHHSGVARKVGDAVQTVDGRDFVPGVDGENNIDWIANEGIRVSRIVSKLRERLPHHPLMQPVFSATPETARVGLFRTPCGDDALYSLLPTVPAHRSEEETVMNASPAPSPRTISLTLQIASDGSVRLQDQAFAEAAVIEPLAAGRALPFDVQFDYDYGTRQGFALDFLGIASSVVVDLPRLSPSLLQKAAPLIGSTVGWPGQYVLDYRNYSVVMHAQRRLAIYSAANVDYSNRYKLGRAGDIWRSDPRISEDHQLGNFYYKNNRFDRGHLSRREDLEYGSTVRDALASAADTCHWTNCTPQHDSFNQGRSLWLGLESYVLEETIFKSDLKVQVITGPVFEEDDPVYKSFPNIQYPVRYWKLLVALDTEGAPSATAYILDQSRAIAQFGLLPKEAAPFGAYQTYQVTVEELERISQLTFTGTWQSNPIKFRDFDPLAKKPEGNQAGGILAQESELVPTRKGYNLLHHFGDVVL